MIMKKILSVLLAMILVFSLAACGGDKADTTSGDSDADADKGSETGGDASSDEVVTINFYEHTDNEAMITQLVDAFNAQSKNIQVKLTIIANDDYDDKIKVMLSGGADVDGFWLRGGSQTRQLADTGALLPLNDLIRENNVDTSKYGSLGDIFSINGKTYGLCTTKSCWLLWYNKDLFDAAGEDYPINLTWEQYTQLAKSLTKDGKWGSVCPNWTMNLGATAVGEYLTDPELKRTMEYAKYQERWYVTDKSHPSIEEMSGSFDINALFAEGNTYMMINGDWEFLLLPDSNPDFTWCAAPMPRFDDAEEGATVGSSSCFSIAANSRYPKETFEFIKFCTYSDEGASIYAQNSGVPAYPSDKALEVYNQKVTVPGTEFVFSSKVGMEQGLDDNYEELNTAFKEELSDALVGNTSLDDAFAKYKVRRDEINAR
jgi:ABC-type glycerol-3-phosphate transport system substrate-binding protein